MMYANALTYMYVRDERTMHVCAHNITHALTNVRYTVLSAYAVPERTHERRAGDAKQGRRFTAQ